MDVEFLVESGNDDGDPLLFGPVSGIEFGRERSSPCDLGSHWCGLHFTDEQRAIMGRRDSRGKWLRMECGVVWLSGMRL